MKSEDNRLHIKELRKKFQYYNVISVDDFNAFYKDVFGDIKRTTVSWHIYELKKMGIIKNISRGQYVLEDIGDNDKTKEYIVITMDIIKSSKLEHQEFNQKLNEKITLLNDEIKKLYDFEQQYNISQGDEIQIIFPFTMGFGKLLFMTICYLYPFQVRYGISIGDVADELKKNSWDMNGPIFWNARDQLEKIKKANNYEGLIISGYHLTDQLCNNLLPLINKSLEKITEKQWEALKYDLTNVDLDQTLKKIGISKTSYYDRLSASNIDDILMAFKSIEELIRLRREIK